MPNSKTKKAININKITFSEFKLFYKTMKYLKINNRFLYYELLQIYGGYGAKLIKKENNKYK